MSERMTNWPTNWPREIAELKAERDVLRAQIERVRDVCDRRSSRVWINDQPGIQVVAVAQILAALNGDSDDRVSTDD